MRFNYLVQLLAGALFCMFVSCKKEPVKSDKGMSEDVFHLTDTVSKQVENPKITEYREFIATLDSSDVTSAVKAVDKFREIFTGETVSLCDSAYVVFQEVYDSLEHVQNIIHQSDTTNYDPLLNNESSSSVPKKLKDFNKKLQDNGFKLSGVDGVPYIEQNRDFLAKNFYSLVSPVMKEYLSELRRENAEGFELDGSISISPRQLVDRAVWYEKFVAGHPDFVFLNNCKEYQKAYLTYLLSGYGKTLVCSDETTCVLSDYYATAYKYLLSKYKATQIAQMVQPYYDALKKNQMADAKKVLKDYHVKGLIYSVR